MDTTKVFYFSGTGNSCAVANDIAAALGETETASIPLAMTGPIDTSAPRLGLVFPVYAWGLPRLVVDFVERLEIADEQYVFAVATCGGTPGRTLLQLQDVLHKKGGHLDASFCVRTVNYTPFSSGDAMTAFVRWLDTKPHPAYADKRLAEIVSTIQQRERHEPETSSFLANAVGGLLYGPAIGAFRQTGRDYKVNATCSQCGICERLCPRGNIRIEDEGPVWGEDCEMCFACLQWCPQNAIEYKDAVLDPGGRHNPAVKVREMLVR